MDALVDLYERNHHTTDKWGTDSSSHSYLTVYDSIFKRLKDSSKRILEIGIYRGDSLNLWAEYFTNATIYGIDKNTAKIDVKLHPNVQVFRRDAYTESATLMFNRIGKFDIIIDDGSHRRHHQKFVITNYINLLRDNGILIIEDAVCWSPEVLKTERATTLLKYFPEHLKKYVTLDDRRAIKNNPNDMLVIFDKASCQE